MGNLVYNGSLYLQKRRVHNIFYHKLDSLSGERIATHLNELKLLTFATVSKGKSDISAYRIESIKYLPAKTGFAASLAYGLW